MGRPGRPESPPGWLPGADPGAQQLWLAPEGAAPKPSLFIALLSVMPQNCALMTEDFHFRSLLSDNVEGQQKSIFQSFLLWEP